jgi:hypothetical protein
VGWQTGGREEAALWFGIRGGPGLAIGVHYSTEGRYPKGLPPGAGLYVPTGSGGDRAGPTAGEWEYATSEHASLRSYTPQFDSWIRAGLTAARLHL